MKDFYGQDKKVVVFRHKAFLDKILKNVSKKFLKNF